MSNIKKKIRKALYRTTYNFFRNYFKNFYTGNLGKVVEENGKLVCYVDKKKIKKGNDGKYRIVCNGILKNDQKIADSYDLNKPIKYVIDGLDFEKKLFIRSKSGEALAPEIIIKNCTFHENLDVLSDCNYFLKNTRIFVFGLLSMQASNLKIEDVEILNKYYQIQEYIRVHINAKTIELLDSQIGDEYTEIKLQGKNVIKFNRTNILGEEINIKTANLVSDEYSKIKATKNIDIQTGNFKKINLKAPKIVYNEENIKNNESGFIELEKKNNPLDLKRLKLIDALKRIQEKCNKINEESVNDYKDSLDSESVGLVLTKDNKNM